MAVISTRTDPSRGAGTVVSLVLAVHDPPPGALRAQLDAIAAQTSPWWECVVVDDASARPDVVELLAAWVAVDPRRRLITRAVNGGIAAATNDGIDAATGDVVAICDHDDVIDPDAVYAVLDHLGRHPDHDVVYSDERTIDAEGRVIAEYHKPDHSPRRHLGHHYLAHLVAARRGAIGDLRVRAEFEPAQDYDFYLRVIEGAHRAGRGVGHIPRILYSWRAIAGSSALDASEKPEMAAAVERCAQAALDRRGISATATTVLHRGAPTTSVRLVSAPCDATVAPIPVGGGASAAEVDAAIRAATADVVCLVPRSAGDGTRWAAPLVADAVRADVGVVGPMVVRAASDGAGGDRTTVLSVGRTVGDTLADPFVGVDPDEAGPWGAFFVAREASAVAPEGLVVERATYLEAGGLATDAGLDVAVAELCATLAASGRATIWNPAAVLEVELPAGVESLLGVRSDGPDARDRLDAELAAAARRRPELRRERFATTGTSAFVHHVTHPSTTARRLVVGGEIELVTSDVFDTVVTRPVATPSDLFVVLGRRLLDDGALPERVTPPMFAAARREAERRARDHRSRGARRRLLAESLHAVDRSVPAGDVVDERIGDPRVEIESHPDVVAPECTLEEIWERMPWGLDAGVERHVEAELAVEAEHLRPIPETLELIRLARRHGVPVVLVSDIYLGADQLRGLLAAAGVDTALVDDVVTSADHRLGKAHGLLARTIAARGVEPTATLHLGDNEVADVATATDLGTHVLHVDVASDRRHVAMPHAALRAWSRSTGADLGISAAVRATLVSDVVDDGDAAAQYGAAIGPALAGFARWVADTAADLGAGTVHCLLREGATIAELMGATAPAGPSATPLHVSRWVTMRAAVVDGTADEILTALARRADLTVDHVVGAFGCDPDDVRRVLGAQRIEPAALPDACARLASDPGTRAQIRAGSADLRRRVLRYLRDRLVLDDGPLVVADVGWGGTIQEGLGRILRADGIDDEPIGLYFALSSAGEERVRRGARMMSYLPSELDDPVAAARSRAVAHHADTVERIMTPATGTLIDVSAEGDPVTRPVDHDPVPRSLTTAQGAMRSVVGRLVDGSPGGLDDPRWSDAGLRAAFAEALAEVVSTPDPTMASVLGSWPHDDVAGTDHRTIAGGDLATRVRYSTARDATSLDPTGRKWIAGLAAQHNPTMAAQLGAHVAGVALEDLCPIGENGVASVSAFSIGSDPPAAQCARVVFPLPGGWSVIHLDAEVDSLRAVRVDVGDHPAIVEVAELALSLGTDLEFDPPPVSIDDLADDGIVWVGARRVGDRRFVRRDGGHLVLPVDADLGAHVRSVEVTVAFRCWRLGPDDPLLVAPIEERLAAHARRARRAVRRRTAR
ncbi:glycosyltransferase [Ilumatobacter sp.]|uniref:glycosyltransferase n=1 Tax=Ilumatobacter sp. TaxID=1967498 RepID=UPI003B515E22